MPAPPLTTRCCPSPPGPALSAVPRPSPPGPALNRTSTSQRRPAPHVSTSAACPAHHGRPGSLIAPSLPSSPDPALSVPPPFLIDPPSLTRPAPPCPVPSWGRGAVSSVAAPSQGGDLAGTRAGWRLFWPLAEATASGCQSRRSDLAPPRRRSVAGRTAAGDAGKGLRWPGVSVPLLPSALNLIHCHAAERRREPARGLRGRSPRGGRPPWRPWKS